MPYDDKRSAPDGACTAQPNQCRCCWLMSTSINIKAWTNNYKYLNIMYVITYPCNNFLIAIVSITSDVTVITIVMENSLLSLYIDRHYCHWPLIVIPFVLNWFQGFIQNNNTGRINMYKNAASESAQYIVNQTMPGYHDVRCVTSPIWKKNENFW